MIRAIRPIVNIDFRHAASFSVSFAEAFWFGKVRHYLSPFVLIEGNLSIILSISSLLSLSPKPVSLRCSLIALWAKLAKAIFIAHSPNTFLIISNCSTGILAFFRLAQSLPYSLFLVLHSSHSHLIPSLQGHLCSFLIALLFF